MTSWISLLSMERLGLWLKIQHYQCLTIQKGLSVASGASTDPNSPTFPILRRHAMFVRSLTLTRSLVQLNHTLRLNNFVPANIVLARTAMSFPYKPNTEPPKDMTVFKNIVSVASSSEKFRRVLWTGRNSQVCFPVTLNFNVLNWCLIPQLVIMTIPVGGEIGEASLIRIYPV